MMSERAGIMEGGTGKEGDERMEEGGALVADVQAECTSEVGEEMADVEDNDIDAEKMEAAEGEPQDEDIGLPDAAADDLAIAAEFGAIAVDMTSTCTKHNAPPGMKIVSKQLDDDDDDDLVTSSDEEEAAAEGAASRPGSPVGDEDDDGAQVNAAPRTKNEIAPAPPPKVVLDNVKGTLSRIGTISLISSLMEFNVLVQADFGKVALDEGTILCFSDRKPLGVIAEVFGPIHEPFYIVRFASAEDIPEAAQVQTEIFYAVESSKKVCTKSCIIKGSDASNMHDEEPAEDEWEFSDDEKEAEFKKIAKQAKQQQAGKQQPTKQKGFGKGGAGAEGAGRGEGMGGGERGRGRGAGGEAPREGYRFMPPQPPQPPPQQWGFPPQQSFGGGGFPPPPQGYPPMQPMYPPQDGFHPGGPPPQGMMLGQDGYPPMHGGGGGQYGGGFSPSQGAMSPPHMQYPGRPPVHIGGPHTHAQHHVQGGAYATGRGGPPQVQGFAYVGGPHAHMGGPPQGGMPPGPPPPAYRAPGQQQLPYRY